MKHERKSSRREFLTGGKSDTTDQPARPVDQAADDGRGLDVGSNRSEHYLEHFSKHAMACEFELFFNMRQFSNSGAAALEAFKLIDDLEQQLSVYRSSSEMSQLNGQAERDWVAVESGFFGLLVRGIQISRWTSGAFDMTSSELSRVWGFSQREGHVPTDQEIQAALAQVGYERVALDIDRQQVKFDLPGLQLNLGGIGKGYALDRAASRLSDAGIEDFVLHGGQSSVIACGRETKQDSELENGWTIGLSHPIIPGRRLAEIYLHDMALGTSGTGRQGFYYRGRRYGHIIDPRNGHPSDHCLSSTVIAESAADCDALATAFFVMKPEEVAQFCEQHSQFKALLVLPGKVSGEISVETFNMSPQDWKLMDSKMERDSQQ